MVKTANNLMSPLLLGKKLDVQKQTIAKNQNIASKRIGADDKWQSPGSFFKINLRMFESPSLSSTSNSDNSEPIEDILPSTLQSPHVPTATLLSPNVPTSTLQSPHIPISNLTTTNKEKDLNTKDKLKTNDNMNKKNNIAFDSPIEIKKNLNESYKNTRFLKSHGDELGDEVATYSYSEVHKETRKRLNYSPTKSTPQKRFRVEKVINLEREEIYLHPKDCSTPNQPKKIDLLISNRNKDNDIDFVRAATPTINRCISLKNSNSMLESTDKKIYQQPQISIQQDASCSFAGAGDSAIKRRSSRKEIINMNLSAFVDLCTSKPLKCVEDILLRLQDKQSVNKHSENKLSDKQSNNKQSPNKQSLNKQSLNKQSPNKQSASKQSVIKQSANKQSPNKQSAIKQSENKQSAIKQSANKQSPNKQSVNKQSPNKQSVNKQSPNKQSVIKQSSNKQYANKSLKDLNETASVKCEDNRSTSKLYRKRKRICMVQKKQSAACQTSKLVRKSNKGEETKSVLIKSSDVTMGNTSCDFSLVKKKRKISIAKTKDVLSVEKKKIVSIEKTKNVSTIRTKRNTSIAKTKGVSSVEKQKNVSIEKTKDVSTIRTKRNTKEIAKTKDVSSVEKHKNVPIEQAIDVSTIKTKRNTSIAKTKVSPKKTKRLTDGPEVGNLARTESDYAIDNRIIENMTSDSDDTGNVSRRWNVKGKKTKSILSEIKNVHSENTRFTSSKSQWSSFMPNEDEQSSSRIPNLIPVKVLDLNATANLKLVLPVSEIWDKPSNSSKQDIETTKHFTLFNFSSGQIKIKPFGGKGLQKSKYVSMVFFVLFGKLKVTIHETSFPVGPGVTFLVPQGNSYNIVNLGDVEAQLMYMQVKDPKEYLESLQKL